MSEDKIQFRPIFNIRRVETVDLKSDLSNLGDLPLIKFSQALQGPQRDEVLYHAIQAVTRAAETGLGVRANDLPTPLHQSALECQTMALLNGIQAWEGFERVRDLTPRISEIRRRAVESRQGDPDAMYSMVAVDEVLTEMGLIRAIGSAGNPIQVARQLFAGHRFLGVASTDTFHAYAVVPLQADPNSQAFGLKIDSLGGRTELLTPADFINLVAQRPLNENQIVYQAVSK